MRLFLVLTLLSAVRKYADVECLPRSFSKEYFNPCRGSRTLNSFQLAKAMAVFTKAFTFCAPGLLHNFGGDPRVWPFIGKRYCLLVNVFYHLHGDRKGHLPPSVYKNASLMMNMIGPQLYALAQAGKAMKCVRVGVERVCFNRRAMLGTFVDGMRCYLHTTNGVGIRTAEEQYLLVQYVMERMF